MPDKLSRFLLDEGEQRHTYLPADKHLDEGVLVGVCKLLLELLKVIYFLVGHPQFLADNFVTQICYGLPERGRGKFCYPVFQVKLGYDYLGVGADK